jgi:aspartate kinase/aspartokinase/homoserine dehydrogenase 1
VDIGSSKVPVPRIVVKFGGSNLKTPADVRRSAAVAAAYGQQLIVVVSAFAGITDALIKALDEAPVALSAIDDFIRGLDHFHLDTLLTHVGATPDSAMVQDGIRKRLDSLDRLLRGVHYLGSTPDYVSDLVLSYGERLSAPIIAAVLRQAGLDAIEMLPESMGLATDGIAGNASVVHATCQASVAAALGTDRTFVVPGFYGIGPDGRTTIFGRGGSDYTAAVLARCVGAASLDLWKDVDGFLSCDPRIAADSRTIPYLSYEEAAELAYFGAKVFHPRTVEPLEAAGIPIRVMNVERFAGTIEPYTVVGVGAGERLPASVSAGVATGRIAGHGTAQVIKSVASTDDIGMVRMEGPGVGSRPGILARATARVDAAGVNISSVITAQTSINLLFKRNDLARAVAALKSEATPGVLAVMPIEDIALVAAVGEGIRDHIGVAARVLGAAAHAGVNILMAQAGASPTAVYLIVRREDRELAARAVHDVCSISYPVPSAG